MIRTSVAPFVDGVGGGNGLFVGYYTADGGNGRKSDDNRAL
jgi:hypothetical protein